MPFAASVIAHAAVVATLPGRGTAPVVSAELAPEWIEAPEPVNVEPVPAAEVAERAELPDPPAALPREPAAHPPSDVPPVGPLDSRDGYDALRAQIAGWNPKLLTGTYTPGGPRIAHPDEMPSRRVPAAVITSVVQASSGRFRVCHGAGLPLSTTISGQVLVAFVIEPDGHVSGARDAGGSFPDDAVRRCVVRAVAQLSFTKPPDGAAQQVTMPVVLQAEEALARPR